jgi:hypothetical protein
VLYCVVFVVLYCVVFVVLYCVVFVVLYCVVFVVLYCVVFLVLYCVVFPILYPTLTRSTACSYYVFLTHCTSCYFMSLFNSCASWCCYVIQFVFPHKVLHTLILIYYIFLDKPPYRYVFSRNSGGSRGSLKMADYCRNM